MNKKLLIISVIIIIVLVVIAAIALILLNANQAMDPGGLRIDDLEDFNVDLTTSKTLDCEDGEYIDTHLHLEEDSVKDNIIERMKENGVGCSLAFVYMNPRDPNDSFEILHEDYGDNLDKFILFFYVDPKKAEDINVEAIDKVRSNANDYFTGIGEMAFYRQPFLQSALTDNHWDEVFNYSQKEDFFIMIHLRSTQQIPELESILKKYPNSKVLLHGPELWRELPDLLTENQNLFFTLDTASLIIEDGSKPNILMYTEGGEDTFNQTLDDKEELILADAFEKWGPVVEAAPNRVMWGTDVSMDWHAEESNYKRLVEFSDKFVEMLPEEFRDRFKKDNALIIFGD